MNFSDNFGTVSHVTSKGSSQKTGFSGLSKGAIIKNAKLLSRLCQVCSSITPNFVLPTYPKFDVSRKFRPPTIRYSRKYKKIDSKEMCPAAPGWILPTPDYVYILHFVLERVALLNKTPFPTPCTTLQWQVSWRKKNVRCSVCIRRLEI